MNDAIRNALIALRGYAYGQAHFPDADDRLIDLVADLESALEQEDREPIAEADAAETFAANCAKRRLEADK